MSFCLSDLMNHLLYLCPVTTVSHSTGELLSLADRAAKDSWLVDLPFFFRDRELSGIRPCTAGHRLLEPKPRVGLGVTHHPLWNSMKNVLECSPQVTQRITSPSRQPAHCRSVAMDPSWNLSNSPRSAVLLLNPADDENVVRQTQAGYSWIYDKHVSQWIKIHAFPHCEHNPLLEFTKNIFILLITVYFL